MPTAFRVPNLSNAELMLFLQSIDACYPSRRWVGDRDAKTAFADCDNEDWLVWLYNNCDGQYGFPESEQFEDSIELFLQAFCDVRDFLHDACNLKTRPAREARQKERDELEQKAIDERTASLAAYQAARKPLEESYRAQVNALRERFSKPSRAISSLYIVDVMNPEYRETMDKINNEHSPLLEAIDSHYGEERQAIYDKYTPLIIEITERYNETIDAITANFAPLFEANRKIYVRNLKSLIEFI